MFAGADGRERAADRPRPRGGVIERAAGGPSPLLDEMEDATGCDVAGYRKRILMPRTYLVFVDTKCDRKGRYHVHKLIEKHGRKANMMKCRC